MKIKDLLNFFAFKDADFINYKTHEPIYDEEKEIEDIHSIDINEKIEKMTGTNTYFIPHYWLTVHLILKEDETNE